MARFVSGGKSGLVRLTLLAVAALAFLVPVTMAETVSIGEGTEVIEFIEAEPLISQARELQMQVVCLAGEIGMVGDITSLEFPQLEGDNIADTEWTIRIKYTGMPGFKKRWVSDRGRWRKVYDGSLPERLPSGARRFELGDSFEYDGIRNILIEIVVAEIPPEGMITWMCFRPPWPRTAFRVSGLIPSLPPSGDARELAGNFRLNSWTPNVAVGIDPPDEPATLAAAFPFHEGFEAGTFAGYWETYRYADAPGTDGNVISVTRNCRPAEGDYHMRMTQEGSVEGAVNAAILTIDLAGEQNVVLSFHHKWADPLPDRHIPCEVMDVVSETLPVNGVAISDDGERWVGVLGLDPAQAVADTLTYMQYFVDLDEAARRARMPFGPAFKIKFQYGLTHFTCLPASGSGGPCPHPCNIDPGAAFDDIAIEPGNPPPTVTGIEPASAENAGTVPVTNLSGTNFIHGAKVRLTRPGHEDIVARDCVVYNTDRITCEIPLEGVAIGTWDIVVINSVDALSGTLPGGFEVTDASLETVAIGDPRDGIIEDFPMGTGSYCRREQAIYEAAEIGRAGTIVGVELYVEGPPDRDLGEWTVRMKHTGLSAYPDQPEWEGSGWTVCRQNTLPGGESGWRTISFTTPFRYNGHDNLMVDFSFNNQERGLEGYCRASQRAAVQSIGLGRSASACPEHPRDWSGPSPRPGARLTRTDIRLVFLR